MAKKTNDSVAARGRFSGIPQGNLNAERRENLIREAAYLRYVQRGSDPGHDLEDWLSAEAELFGREAKPSADEPADITELGMQESGARGFWRDDALKRITRQRPQRGISQVESMEPREAPPRE